MKKDTKDNKISLFQGKEIRKTICQKEWWFSIVDVCGVLSESPTPRQYWEKIKIREFPDFQLSPNWGQLKKEVIKIYRSVVGKYQKPSLSGWLFWISN